MHIYKIVEPLPVPSDANISFFNNERGVLTYMVTKRLVYAKGGLRIDKFDPNTMPI
jgi:hypothetical protein